MEVITGSEEETKEEAKRFFGLIEKEKNTKTATTIALFGDLGSGKTVFVKGIAEALGIEERVVSPTFVIERRYQVDRHDFSKLIHIDAYRLDSSKSLLSLGWRNTLKIKTNIVCLEWSENVPGAIPDSAFSVSFDVVSEKERRIKYLDR